MEELRLVRVRDGHGAVLGEVEVAEREAVHGRVVCQCLGREEPRSRLHQRDDMHGAHPAHHSIDAAATLGLRKNDAEQTLARLGSIARMVGATMSNTANPTLLRAGYKHNVIPGTATAGVDGRFLPGYEQEFYDTITELLGDKVRYEAQIADVAVETTFDGELATAITASLQHVDPEAVPVPFIMSAGTDAKAWSKLGIRCFGFAPLRLPPELDFVALFHLRAHARGDAVDGDAARGDEPIGFAARAVAAFGDVLVESHRRILAGRTVPLRTQAGSRMIESTARGAPGLIRASNGRGRETARAAGCDCR